MTDPFDDELEHGAFPVAAPDEFDRHPRTALVRRNKNNKKRGATFERTVAKAVNGRRTGPLGGRDDVMTDDPQPFAIQTKKTINFSVRQARVYLDDLRRSYPTRTALVVHAEPGRDRDAVVILSLADWLEWHGPMPQEDAA